MDLYDGFYLKMFNRTTHKRTTPLGKLLYTQIFFNKHS